MKTEIGIKENCSNSPDTSVWEGSGRQDPFCRKSRKTIYKYYLGEWVCRISGLYYFFFFRLMKTDMTIKEICRNYIYCT